MATNHQIFKILVYQLGVENRVGGLSILARELSKLDGRTKPWSWRYIRQVINGTLTPSARLLAAAKMLQKKTTGPEFESGNTSFVPLPIQVLSTNRAVEGSQIPPADPKPCIGCKAMFVPNVMNRKKCYVCSPPRKRRTKLNDKGD